MSQFTCLSLILKMFFTFMCRNGSIIVLGFNWRIDSTVKKISEDLCNSVKFKKPLLDL